MFSNTAHLYDVIYSGKDYAAEAEDLHRLVQSFNPGARSLLDVACGTGGHLVHLRREYEVAGVDADSGMLAQAAAQLPGVLLVEADMRAFDLSGNFDAVVCLFSSIGYMPSVEDLNLAVATMATHLSPQGVLIIDGWVRPDAWQGSVTTHLETSSRESLSVARATVATRKGNKTVLEMHHLVTSQDSVQYLVDRHDLTLFAPAEYMEAFALAGLQALVVDSPMAGRDRYISSLSLSVPP